MRFLKTNTAVIVTVGPFYDKTDGVTIENALTATNERITLTVDLDEGSAPTLVLDNITGAASATANDIVVITNCDAGLYQIELAAANVNYLGRAMLTITDAANHVPVFHEFMIVSAQFYNFMCGATIPDVNVTKVGGTSQTAGDIPALVTTVDGIVDDILVDTAVIGALGAGLTALATQASVNVINGIVDAILIDTGTTLDAALAVVDANVDAILVDTGTTLDAALAVVDANVDAILVDTGTTLDAKIDIIDTNVDGLVASTAPTAAAIADAVWDELASGHVGAGSTGAALAAGSIATVDAKVDLILADTDELQTDLVNGGRLDLLIDAILLDTGTTLDGKLSVIDGIVDDILVDTGITLPAVLVPITADTKSMRRGGHVKTLTLAGGGTLYEATDVLTLVQTGGAECTITVLTVAAGVIATFELTTGGYGYETANGLATTGHTGDATFNVTAVNKDLTTIESKIDIIDTNVDALTAANPAAIADAVWDEAIAGHAGAGSTGEKLAAAASAGDPWTTALPGAYGAGTAGKKLSDMAAEVTAVLVDTGTTLDAALAVVDANVDAILVDTGTTLDAALAVVDANVDAILVDTGTTLDAKIDIIDTNVDGLVASTAPTVAAIADAVWDEVISTGHGVGDSAAVKLMAAAAGLATAVAGLGAIACVVTVTVSAVALQDCDVWVTSDAAGATVVAGTLQTNASGQVTFYLDAGTYYVWQQKDGYNFTNPDTLTVT